VEHEDHEGGLTDSLARKGARAVIDHEEDGSVVQPEQEEGVIRAPSVRDRQALNAGAVAQGGMRGVRRRGLPDDASAKEIAAYEAGLAAARGIQPGSKEVPVVATRLGQYPADGRLRARGEAFVYIMGPKETELPSWMEDPTGKIPSRDLTAVREAENRTVIEVRGKSVSVVE
jgi:hypothetical protein